MTVDGFYDGVVALSDKEGELIAELPFDEKGWLDNAQSRSRRRDGLHDAGTRLGPADVRDERDVGRLHRRRPQDDHPEGGDAKVSFRLVAEQDPLDVQDQVRT